MRLTIPPTFKIITDIEFVTQTWCGLVQCDVFINTPTYTIEMSSYFRFVDEGVDYIHSKTHDVVCI